jgi:tetratricopeptide (TPR) repeat protein
MTRTILALFCLGTMMIGCGGGRTSGICAHTDLKATAQGDAKALAVTGEEGWKGRLDQGNVEKAIESWEKSLAINPDQADLRVKLARAHYFLADGHLRFDEEKSDVMLKHFEAATNHSELALGQKYPGYAKKYCARRPFKQALAQVDKGAAPAMYWYASALGKYALAKSIVMILNEKDRIRAMMTTIRELDSTFFFTGPDRYFGAFYTKIPFPSGDLVRSAKHFEASIKGSPNYLASRVLYAELNRIKAGDRAKFKELLDAVVAFDVNSAPELLPENTIEQRKAKALLEEIDVYFPEE